MNIWITKRDNAYSVPRLNISDNCVKYGYSKNYIYKFNNADCMGIYGYSISNRYL